MFISMLERAVKVLYDNAAPHIFVVALLPR